MFFFTLLLGVWLLPKADTLKCYACEPNPSGACNDTQKQCLSLDYQCVVTRVVRFAGGSKLTDVQKKGCMLAENCIDMSVRYGISGTVFINKCCTGDLCNNYTAPEYKSTPNGKKCFSCEGQNCTRTLNCEGTEDRCIKGKRNATGTSLMLKGCASAQMCSDKTIGQDLLDFSCCQGNYCNGDSSNSASSTRVVLLLLSVPLVSVGLFH